MDDHAILELIKKGDERALDYLYRKHFRMMARLVVRNSGSEDDAKDIFQDALIIFWEKARLGKLELSSKISTYLYSVCQNLWHKELTRKQRLVSQEHDVADTPPDAGDRQERIAIVERCLQLLKPDCRQILMYYYFDQLPMTDIAEKMEFANADSAKTKKYKCKQELDRLIKSQFSPSDLLD
jgi:RNA polymerase sigma factor (sigma-70 family)